MLVPLAKVACYAWGGYSTYKTLSSAATTLGKRQRWVCFWITLVVIEAVEPIVDWILFWVPFYYNAKLALFLALCYWQTRATTPIFKRFIHPVLSRKQKEITVYEKHVRRTLMIAHDTFSDGLGRVSSKLPQIGWSLPPTPVEMMQVDAEEDDGESPLFPAPIRRAAVPPSTPPATSITTAARIFSTIENLGDSSDGHDYEIVNRPSQLPNAQEDRDDTDEEALMNASLATRFDVNGGATIGDASLVDLVADMDMDEDLLSLAAGLGWHGQGSDPRSDHSSQRGGAGGSGGTGSGDGGGAVFASSSSALPTSSSSFRPQVYHPKHLTPHPPASPSTTSAPLHRSRSALLDGSTEPIDEGSRGELARSVSLAAFPTPVDLPPNDADRSSSVMTPGSPPLRQITRPTTIGRTPRTVVSTLSTASGIGVRRSPRIASAKAGSAKDGSDGE
ncbi:hypothetical protein HKX48_003895 [Thoreauomyces humboldtii]|nr:hypothetical protein HKX48_003895 [Thoreauomyces humboldtii]